MHVAVPAPAIRSTTLALCSGQLDRLLLPVFFAAGMPLIDTTENIFVLEAYGWAFVKPIRQLYYFDAPEHKRSTASVAQTTNKCACPAE